MGNEMLERGTRSNIGNHGIPARNTMGTIMERAHAYPARCLVSEYEESAVE